MNTIPFRSGFITIVGAPNVGKSTLLNTLMGTKLAIVTPKPQTTRHRILGVKNVPNAQMIFVDTPGIHVPHTRLNRYMMQAVAEALSAPNIVLYLTDASRRQYPDLRFLQQYLSGHNVPVFWVLNKVDQASPQELLPLIAGYEHKASFAEIVPIAALHGENVPTLIEVILRYLPEGPQYFPEDMPTDRSERFFVAELIREQVMLHTHEEVPYAVAVEVEAMQERRDGGIEIDACILVEKDSHKGILLGRQGRMIKMLGMQARQAIGEMLHCTVHLRLLVRLKKDWRQHEATLRDLGFGDL
jgi:GTP-binding protein Era